jgi:hypothetical protein
MKNYLASLGLLLAALWGALASLSATAKTDWSSLKLPFKEGTIRRLQEGECYTKSSLQEVPRPPQAKGKAASSPKSTKEMKFTFAVAGWHRHNCATALPRLTRYEDYQRYLPFVVSSTYQTPTQTIDLAFKVWILPFSLRLNFQLPRMEKEGVYPFTFKEGFLPNLKGKVTAKDVDRRCLILITADWQGPDPGFNPTLFELFTQTAATLGIEKMLRVTGQMDN